MGATTKISAEYKIEIPEEVRSQRGWKAGQELEFVLRGDSVVLVPVRPFDDLFGTATGANTDDYRDRNDRY